MKVRVAVTEDVPQLVAIGRRFRGRTIYAEQFSENVAQIERFCLAMMTRPDTCVLVAVDGEKVVGVLIVVVAGHPFSAEIMATEVVWWVDEDVRTRGAGLMLLRAAERWAREQGAVALQMGAPVNHENVARLYGHLGFREMERLYQKALS